MDFILILQVCHGWVAVVHHYDSNSATEDDDDDDGFEHTQEGMRLTKLYAMFHLFLLLISSGTGDKEEKYGNK